MQKLLFEIAKKMEKMGPSQSGVRLSSLKGGRDEGVSMILIAKSYEDIKEAVTAYRMMKGASLNYRSRGKSLEVFSDSLASLSDFARGISFNPDDADDVVEFCAGLEGYFEGLSFERIALDRDSLSLILSCELEDGASPEALYQALIPVLGRFDMGVIKPL